VKLQLNTANNNYSADKLIDRCFASITHNTFSTSLEYWLNQQKTKNQTFILYFLRSGEPRTPFDAH